MLKPQVNLAGDGILLSGWNIIFNSDHTSHFDSHFYIDPWSVVDGYKGDLFGGCDCVIVEFCIKMYLHE